MARGPRFTGDILFHENNTFFAIYNDDYLLGQKLFNLGGYTFSKSILDGLNFVHRTQV